MGDPRPNRTRLPHLEGPRRAGSSRDAVRWPRARRRHTARSTGSERRLAAAVARSSDNPGVATAGIPIHPGRSRPADGQGRAAVVYSAAGTDQVPARPALSRRPMENR